MFEACTPRQDVLIGELAEDQFAASLADVAHSDDAPEVYADPKLFFEKTYPTEGLQELLGRLATRFVSQHNGEYSGTNGVLRLDTSFGGGKTHNQIAAYHLAKQPGAVPDLSEFVDEEEMANGYGEAAALGLDVNTAVFVGTHVDATSA
jgi:predicted AAA+ superfamily ATPase